jgi:rhamnogalacturonyl hydrolase YesR
MHNYPSIIVYLCVLFFPLFSACSQNQKSDINDKILDAIQIGADYCTHTLLDEEGKSRCDYNMTEGKWYEYEPPWHTGQVIYALVESYKLTGKPEYLEAAKKAGDWWISLEIKDHPKLKGMLRAVHGDHAGEVIVFATISDGSAGLFRLYEATGNKKYADAPTSAGNWMMQHMWVPEHGVFYDNVDPKTGEVLKENSPFWPNKEKQELFDVSRPNNEGSLYLDMYKYTGEEKYKSLFIKLCESLVEKQGPEGLWMDFMPNNKEDGSIHPRFNLWYAESLLEGYELTKDKKYLQAAIKTARIFAKFQKKDGTIYYRNYLDGRVNQNSVCGSAVAFAGIIWMRLAKYGAGEEFKKNIEKSLHWLLKNRYSSDHPDKNLAGATINTRMRRKKGKIWLTNRDIGTSFSLRFFADYYRYLNKTSE